MDGKTITNRTLQLINEVSTSAMVNSRLTYDFINDAAKDWVIKTECLTAEDTLTTVASQTEYVLKADYLGLYLKQANQFYVKYYDGSNYTFIYFKEYADIYYENDTTDIDIPSDFTIRDYGSLYSQVTGTASADGAATGGRCLLTTATDKFTNVSAGEQIHNTTDGSDGVVLSVTDTKNIYVALFGGTANDISAADAFIIQPRGRLMLVLNPPPDDAGDYVYVPYLQSPAPVYHDYGVFRINFDYTEAFANYAAWRYKYKDKAFDYGDKFYAAYLAEINKYRRQTPKAFAQDAVRIYPRLK
jgi:hypothetical protein